MAPGAAIRGGGIGGGAVAWAVLSCVAIGWVAVTDEALSVGRTSIGVSLFCIAGIGGVEGSGGALGASWGCSGWALSGWAFKDSTGAPKAGSNGAAAIALAT